MNTPSPSWIARGREILADRRPLVMGIVNVTPDSFSDGGRWADPASALAHARSLVEAGADLLDIGGESSRPGAVVVPVEEEIRRVLPAIEAIRGALPGVPISIDTVKPEVARLALDAGASILNDIAALTNPAMLGIAADSDCGVVLMHMIGDPRTMQDDPRYDDVVEDVREFLVHRVEAVEAAGIARGRIAIDPGIGFGKTHEHNRLLLRHLDRFANLGCALLVGISRKGLLGKITGRPIDQRATASVVSSLAAAVKGANVLRVHDVGAMVDAVKVWEAVRGWDLP